MASSMVLPNSHRNHMLPRSWSTEVCRNMLPNAVPRVTLPGWAVPTTRNTTTLATISPTVTTGGRSIGMLSLAGNTPPQGYGRPRLRETDGRAGRHDPPRLAVIAGQRQRPALGGARPARPAGGPHRRPIPVLDVAVAGDVDLQGHGRRLGGGVEVHNPDPVDLRPPDHDPHRAARVAGVQQVARG